jgi:hypothetical protein
MIEEGEPVALGEVSLEEMFSSLTLSPAVHAFSRALEQLFARADGITEDLSLRMIRVPALSILAIWLHGEALDWVLALPPTHHPVRQSQIYRGETFAERIQAAARRRLNRSQQHEMRRSRL